MNWYKFIPIGKGARIELSKAYAIVTKGHGGEMKVESKDEKGTTFFVELPIHK